HIKVYTVDINNGNLMAEGIIYSTGFTATTGNTNLVNMYPTHSIYTQGHLYICGYVCQETTSYPSSPSFIYSSFGGAARMDKEAFVLQYDPAGNSVVNARQFNYHHTTDPSGANSVPNKSGYPVTAYPDNVDVDM